jgi:phosphoribosylformylglycinamidine synthase
LNFGNPYNKEVYYQFVHAIKGMGEACKKFDTPVTGGNVSFYNQSSDNDAVFPTPTIGMVGLIRDGKKHMTLDFKQAGDVIYLIGESKNDIASSQYLVSQHKVQLSPAPAFNLDEEFAVQQATSKAIANNLIQSAHDISEGGLFISLLESAMPNNLGFDIAKQNTALRNDAFLFGEAQSRIVVSVSSGNIASFEKLLQDNGVKLEKLGTVTTGNIQISGADFGQTEQYKNTFLTSLESKLA